MQGTQVSTGSTRRRVIAAAVTGVLALTGVTVLGVAGLQRPSERTRAATTVPVQEPAADPAPVGPAKAASPNVTAPVLSSSEPLTIAIPAIGVRSKIQRLGLTAQGTLEVPAPGPHYDEVGWYKHSPTPGAFGPSVVAGHADSAAGPSVFFRLAEVRAGDTVRVTRADGSVAIFEVDSVRNFRKARFPTRLVYGNTDHAALRLITCGGPLDDRGHYRDNVVVLASLVGSVDA